METFNPYSRTKTKLGLMYFPHAKPADARRHLMRWINACPPLLYDLRALGYKPRQHYFTAAQVKRVVAHLGVPE